MSATTENISVKLPQLLHAKVSEEARLRSVSKSTVIREALERLLDERGTKSKAVSCAVLAAGLIGSVRSGRRDLATNKSLLAQAILDDAKRGRKRRS
jgi:Arc/MetJ-type ribon-helix-helix transcriptional regulator